MDKFVLNNVEKIMSTTMSNEPDTWKRADLCKIIDQIYMKGFEDGEKSEREFGKGKEYKIKAVHGKRFRVNRNQMDFQSFTKLCQALGTRLDSERIDFIGFDVVAFKTNSLQFENQGGLNEHRQTH